MKYLIFFILILTSCVTNNEFGTNPKLPISYNTNENGGSISGKGIGVGNYYYYRKIAKKECEKFGKIEEHFLYQTNLGLDKDLKGYTYNCITRKELFAKFNKGIDAEKRAARKKEFEIKEAIEKKLKLEKVKKDLIMTKANTQCQEFGFKKDTEKYSECLLKIYEIEMNISLAKTKKQNDLAEQSKRDKKLVELERRKVELAEKRLKFLKKKVKEKEDRERAYRAMNAISAMLNQLGTQDYNYNNNKISNEQEEIMCWHDCLDRFDDFICQKQCMK